MGGRRAALVEGVHFRLAFGRAQPVMICLVRLFPAAMTLADDFFSFSTLLRAQLIFRFTLRHRQLILASFRLRAPGSRPSASGCRWCASYRARGEHPGRKGFSAACGE